MILGSLVALAVAYTGSCSFDSTPNLGISIALKGAPKKKKKKKKKKKSSGKAGMPEIPKEVCCSLEFKGNLETEFLPPGGLQSFLLGSQLL